MVDIESLEESAKTYFQVIHQNVWHTFWFPEQPNAISDSVSRIQKDGIIQIREMIKQSQWQEFESRLAGINRSLIVITDGLPKKWVTNKKLNVLQVQSVLNSTLTKFKPYLKNYNFNYFNRQSSLLEYDYFLMYGRWEYHRETVMKELESRAVLTNSLYSRPSVKELHGDRKEELEDQPGRSIEDNKIDAPPEFEFNHGSNFDTVIKNSQRCCCSVVLENNGLLTESDGTITEKSLWPILAQVPFVWAVAPNRIQQLTEWGFQPNDPPCTDLRSLTKQLLWLRSEFADTERAQRWQDNQGKIINHNLTILKTLADRIDENTHRQLTQLRLL
jgi:hypothetical protein|tara:strand:+ start:323 stop:1315 length:993 start_codon:yes stop_codon:yes gene_type:complete